MNANDYRRHASAACIKLRNRGMELLANRVQMALDDGTIDDIIRLIEVARDVVSDLGSTTLVAESGDVILRVNHSFTPSGFFSFLGRCVEVHDQAVDQKTAGLATIIGAGDAYEALAELGEAAS